VLPDRVEFRDPLTLEELGTLRSNGKSRFECAAFSPDARYLLVGGTDENGEGWIGLFDLAEDSQGESNSPLPLIPGLNSIGKLVQEFAGHAKRVRCVSFHPDGEHFVSGGSDGNVLYWSLKPEPAAFELVVDQFAVASKSDVSVAWNAQTRTIQVRKGVKEPKSFPDLHEQPLRDLVVSPDGSFFVSASDQDVFLRETQSGTRRYQLAGAGSRVAISPDGKWIAAYKVGSSSILVFDSKTGEVHRELKDARPQPGQEGDGAMAFHPSSQFLAVGGLSDEDIGIGIKIRGNVVTIWDLDEAEPLHKLKGHTQIVRSVAYSPDGRYLASVSRERADHGQIGLPGELYIWDAETGELLHDLQGHTEGLESVTFTRDSLRVISGGAEDALGGNRSSARHAIHIWDVSTGEEFYTIENRPSVAYLTTTSDGSLLARDSSGWKVWPRTQVLRNQLKPFRPLPTPDPQADQMEREFHLSQWLESALVGNAYGKQFHESRIQDLTS
ncbi:MAG: hypothetical protein KDA84_24560, partial [Planctomycetaceae bacterium]|nr:hypothetical protein [Planctomycetaceae bacterium]